MQITSDHSDVPPAATYNSIIRYTLHTHIVWQSSQILHGDDTSLGKLGNFLQGSVVQYILLALMKQGSVL